MYDPYLAGVYGAEIMTIQKKTNANESLQQTLTYTFEMKAKA